MSSITVLNKTIRNSGNWRTQKLAYEGLTIEDGTLWYFTPMATVKPFVPHPFTTAFLTDTALVPSVPLIIPYAARLGLALSCKRKWPVCCEGALTRPWHGWCPQYWNGYAPKNVVASEKTLVVTQPVILSVILSLSERSIWMIWCAGYWSPL